MSGEDKNKLDELFKSELDNSVNQFDFMEQDWDAMEDLLDANKKNRGLVYWLPMLSGAAALLLIALGWWYFKPNQAEQKQQVAVHQTKPLQKPVEPDVISAGKSKTLNSPAFATTAPVFNHNTIAVKAHHITSVQSQPSGTIQSANSIPDNSNITTNDHEVLAAASTDNIAVKQHVDSVVTTANAVAAVNDGQDAKNENANPNTDAANPVNVPKIKPSVQKLGDRKGPQFGLAVIFSPDVNGVNSLQQTKVGTNIGMLFSVNFGKLAISTGAAYSRKPYLTDFSNYHTSYVFKTDPASVSADCRVLDVPLNVDYQVYHKSQNSFSIGTGLSSYIMLREQYNYQYSQPGITGPTSFTIVNRNQHILGVLNLNVTYIRQLNSKLGIMAQPYYKIPLTDIGYSQVRLRSAGVALGLHWNINQSKIP